MKMNILILMPILFMLLGCEFQPRPETADISAASKMVDFGTLQMRTGHLDQAQAAFELAYQVGGLSSALDGLGCVAFKKAELSTAEKYFLRAYNESPDYNNSLTNLSMLYEIQKRWEEAEQV